MLDMRARDVIGGGPRWPDIAAATGGRHAR
jgi:hypothetical protein